jgi:hypothetical protein
MAETRRKFDEDPAGCRTEWPEETFDALAAVDRRSEAWQPISATTTAFSAQRGTCPCSARRCTAACS